MVLDPEVDARLPGALDRQGQRSQTRDGRALRGRVDEPKGDPGNTLSRAELEDKALRLAAYRGGASEAEMRARRSQRVWAIAGAPRVDAPARLTRVTRDAAALSYLFVPGDRPERFDKALASGADAVIVDLEDAVAPTTSRRARARAAAVARAPRPMRPPVIVRINAAGTPWLADDLALCAHARRRGRDAGRRPSAPMSCARPRARATACA